MEQVQTPASPVPPRKSHKWVIVIIVIILGFTAYTFLPFASVLFFEWRDGNKSDKILEQITEEIKPGPARDYQFHNPSAAVLNRKIDCKKLAAFQEKLPIVTPACINLYKTSAEEINKMLDGKKYDRIILYGENIIWDAPGARDPKYPDWDLGKAIFDSAKFNDQITVPTLLKLYGQENMSFVTKLVPDKNFPFPAIYYRIGTDAEVQKACGSQDQSEFAGCALGMWAIMSSERSLGEQISLANQKIWRNTGAKDPDYLAFDFKWPENCYTDDTILHETAHALLYSLRNINPADVLVATRYFNEHQADLVAILGVNLVCGENTVSNFRTKDKKEMSPTQFNSIYPPTKMGSFSPDPKNGCQLVMLNEWNRFLAKGNFETQFKSFIGNLKSWMKSGKTISDDKSFEEFIIQLNNDKDSHNTMQYHGCPY